MILCPKCVTGVDENGKAVAIQVPIRLAGYPQINAPGGMLLAWVCDKCGFDDSLERFASRPEHSYTAYRERIGGAGDPRFPWPPPLDPGDDSVTYSLTDAGLKRLQARGVELT